MEKMLPLHSRQGRPTNVGNGELVHLTLAVVLTTMEATPCFASENPGDLVRAYARSG
jgi:hypothetical protein